MQKTDSAEWVLRTARKILRESGYKAARRFIDSRGGSAKWEVASREIARASLVRSQPGKYFPHFIKFAK
jgi:hypothetical protein